MLFVSLHSFSLFDTSKVDGVELRLDLFPSIDTSTIRTLCASLAVPVIFTVRKSSQGGHFQASEEERLNVLEELLLLEPAFVDLEYDTDPLFVKHISATFPRTKIIFSYHDFTATPDDLASLLSKVQSPYAFAYKIATYARSSLDALRMLLFVREQKGVKMSGICMGTKGQITRILGPVFGNFIDYACLEEKDSIFGQITVSELDHTYHYSALTPTTALYGLIGDPVDKSIGHKVHNALIRHFSWNAVYVPIHVKKEELAPFLELAGHCGFLGLSVTMPLKEDLFSLLLHKEALAQEIGAINTLVFSEGKYIGYNTDAKGALDALESTESVKHKKILLIGAGGAARAIAVEATRRGAELFIVNRSKERACRLAETVSATGGGLQDFAEELFSIAINATTHPFPLSPACFSPLAIVMDITTAPQYTLFLKEAIRRGCTPVFGYEMFAHQAKEQLCLWFNTDIDISIIKEECSLCL